MFQELLEKLKEAEESHGSLQAECEQYRTVLAETVSGWNQTEVEDFKKSLQVLYFFFFFLIPLQEGMLKHLQKSVEEEELVWKSKMANSEEQLNEAGSHKNLRKASFIFYAIKPK